MFKVGDEVENAFFGVGTIIEIANDTSYKVKFEKGVRFVQAEHLELCDESEYYERIKEYDKDYSTNSTIAPRFS